jgi:hypothetical protein
MTAETIATARRKNSSADVVSRPSNSAKTVALTRQLEILAQRSLELADRVAAGQLGFIDAVDLAYEAAVWADLPNAIDASGLIDTNIHGAATGDDIVQATIAAAFANARTLA